MGRVDGVVARNFLALGSGEAVARIVAFLATVYLAQTLGATLFGTIGFASAVLLYPARLVDGGLDAGLGVSLIAANPARLSTIAPSLLTARLLVALSLVVLLAAVGLFWMPQPDGAVLALYGLTLLMVALGTRWIHLGLERGRLVAVARTAGEIVMVVLVLALVQHRDDLNKVPLAQFVGDSVAALVLMAMLHRSVGPLVARVDWSIVRTHLPRAVPLVGSALLGLMIFNSDLIFLRGFRGASAVGYYAAAYALVSFLGNMGSTYILSLLPTFTRIGETAGAQAELYHTSLVHASAAALPAAAGGTLLAPEIVRLVFGPGYAPSVLVLQGLLWSVPLTILRSVPTVALLAREQERQVLRTTAWAAGTNVLLNILLIPVFGLIGAAVATVATEALRLGLALLFVQPQGLGAPRLMRLWRPICATAVMAAALILLRPGHVALGLGIGLLAYAVGLVLCGGIRLRWGDRPRIAL